MSKEDAINRNFEALTNYIIDLVNQVAVMQAHVEELEALYGRLKKVVARLDRADNLEQEQMDNVP